MIRNLDSKLVEDSFKSCLSGLSLQGRHIAIDGKALRRTIPMGKKKALVNMVNVWVAELGLSFGQQQVESKSNEIDAIPKLLDQVDCQGSIITIDAIGCQKGIVEKIIAKQAAC
ncbi:MAG: ISAs1 family transposase [Flammeovirgaceae bacterium]|nr:ISAs1 family transposase [Flammeovirgaceae bacterium]